MQHTTLMGKLLAVVVTVTTTVGAAMAQAPSTPVSPDQKQENTTPLVPSGKVKMQGALGKADRRRELVRQVNQLIVQQNVKDAALKKAKEAYNNTALMALKYHFVAIEITGDLADILPMLSATIDDLRAEVRGDLEQKKHLAKQRTDQVQESQGMIDELGQQILTGKDAEGKELGAEQLDDLRAVMHQKILHRNERQLDREGYEAKAKSYEQELADLRKLDRRLEGMSLVSQAYLERLMDAVENEREGIVAEEVSEGRKELKEVVAALETRAKEHEEPIPSTRHDKGEQGGVAAGDLAKRLKQELKPEGRKVVDEELEKLQQRMSKPKAK